MSAIWLRINTNWKDSAGWCSCTLYIMEPVTSKMNKRNSSYSRFNSLTDCYLVYDLSGLSGGQNSAV
jgi:hypothetical protein